MRTSTTIRRLATTLIATASLVGIGGMTAAAAHAAPGDKELVYRGSVGNGLVLTAFNADGSGVFLQSDTNSPRGQWQQVSTVSSGGGQPAFQYRLRASVDAGKPLCLTAIDSVNVAMKPCDLTSDRQKWFHPTAVSGPGGTLPTKNVHTKFHLGQNGPLGSVTLTQSVQIGPHFWAKRTV
ncbi:hypothetical protein [Pseudonocardia lacus]|uniref:hypothetical protein n=1 Tax=Pseudonocardia lacus TaxID=2835865 RepID=UPI001BDD425B|nr:hypothetical protein [Pseudonocardia lacus]